MGRAIDMENDIGALKLKLEKLENTVRGMVSKLDQLDEKSTKTKHVDLVGVPDTELGTCITGVPKDEIQTEADHKRAISSSKQRNTNGRTSKKKTK